MATRLPLMGEDPAAQERVLAWRGRIPVTVTQFMGDVMTLAEALPTGTHLVNACADRYHFLVGLAAALICEKTTVLPPSVSPDDLKRYTADFGGIWILADGVMPAGFAVVPYVDAHQQQRISEVPSIRADLSAIVAFTSGSTGKPLPCLKTFESLVRGAKLAADRLFASGTTVVATVPAQHMYGIETSIMLPLQQHVAVYSGRPLLPLDIAAALEQVPAPRILVTSPIHLRALTRTHVSYPPIASVVCSTAPLSVALASAAERVMQAPVFEIYGSTETGSVGSRRTVEEEDWSLYAGIRVSPQAEDVVVVSGGHLLVPVALNDQIELVPSGRMRLLGRKADILLVGGKRASLAALNDILRAVPGVEDGVFFAPERVNEEADRLCAFAVAPTHTVSTVRAVLAQSIDPIFLPRPLYLVAALPRRAGVDKIVREDLLNLFDAQEYTEDLWFDRHLAVFHDHFPGDPLVPAALLLDHVVECYGRHVLGRQIVGVKEMKWVRPVRPDIRCIVHFSGINADRVSFRVVDAGQVLHARGQLLVSSRRAYG